MNRDPDDAVVSTENPLRLVLVEDVPEDADLELHALKLAGMRCEVQRVDTESSLVQALKEAKPDVILSDFTLPGAFDGLDALEISRRLCPDVPFIFVSGTIGEERAIEAIKRGATDYVLKSNLQRLPIAVTRAVKEFRIRRAERRSEMRLRASQQRFSSFMQHLPGLAFIKDGDGRYVYVNETFEQYLGRSAEDIVGLTDEQLWPAEDARLINGLATPILRRDEFQREIQHLLWKGVPRSWLFHYFSVTEGDGGPHLIGGIALDVTERLRAEERVARLSRIRAVLGGINSAIVRIRDRQELFLEACRIAVVDGGFGLAWIGTAAPGDTRLTPAAWHGANEGYLEDVDEALTRFSEDPGVGGLILGGEARVVVNDIDTDPRIAFRDACLVRGYRSLVALALRIADETVGALFLYSVQRHYFNDDEMLLLRELAADISFALEHMHKEEQLNYLAFYDSLTGLANRSLFSERFNSAIKNVRGRRRPVSLVLFDMERFRSINEALGRDIGDDLLRRLAAHLVDKVGDRANVARIAGDTFAVLVQGAKPEARLGPLLNTFCSTSGLVLMTRPEELRVALRAGVAVYPGDGEDFETLFANAETALKKARATRDRYLLYESRMNARVAERLSLENRLRKALNEAQFLLHYQPKVDASNRTITGLEALIRWQDPDGGLISPAHFIPLLEETGLILQVGRWVLHQAVRDHLHWVACGLPAVRVAVNISALQLRSADFVTDIQDAVALFGSQPCQLDLEITESMLMTDVEASARKLAVVRDLGVGIAIDDFGTGHSSLKYIARLPIDALKIDRSFVLSMDRSRNDEAVVSSIISLASALNLSVVAEGVETEAQARQLGHWQCQQMQGYLFSRPVPAADIEDLLSRPSLDSD